MGRRKKWKVDLLSGQTAALILLSGLFLCGGVAGCVCAGLISDPGGALLDYVRGYLQGLTRGELSGQFVGVLWETARVPLAVLVLGFTALGVAGIPVLFAVRGFLLCYAVSALYRLLGLSGLLPGFALFGLSALLWLPVLFSLGTRGLLGAYGLLRRTMGDGRWPLRGYGSCLRDCGLCAVSVCLCAAVECWAVPVLLQKIAGTVFSG